MNKLIALVVLSALYSSTTLATVETQEFEAAGLKTLTLKNLSGDAEISVSENNKAVVSAEKVDFEKACSLKIGQTGSELNIEVEKTGWFNKARCKVHFKIQVPKAIAMNLKSGSGNIEVTGTKGPISFRIGSGDVEIDAEVSELEGATGSGNVDATGNIGSTQLKSGSGTINLTGLTGDTDLKTGSGNLTITYKSAIQKGALSIKTGSGDATVVVPSEMKVLTDFKAGSGRIYNELGDTSDAGFKISMKAGSGDLKIQKLK